MNNIRLVLAIVLAKLAIHFSPLAGSRGTDFPGRLARRIYPGILPRLAANIKEEILVVTGTNGKTTTSNMIASILKESGYSIVHNRAGANMLGGITTAFIRRCGLWGNKFSDYALLETDEANLPLLIKEVKPRLVLITNFFRDQLDRYGELDRIITLIKEAVRGTDIELLLNADDPLAAHFQNDTGLYCWYYGFGDTVYDTTVSAESREGRFCVFCGWELKYERYHYAQLGKYYCPQCHNTNPSRNFTGHDLKMSPQITFMVNDLPVASPYRGFYNAYNILAAVSLAKLAGVEHETVQTAIAAYEPQAGRMEKFNIGGRNTILILVKNPTGLDQTLSTLLHDQMNKSLLFILNDNAADGRDISWIWDADFEMIRQANINQVVCAGLRSGDAALRFKYAGHPAADIHLEPNLFKAIRLTCANPGQVNYILCTYTALFETQKILRQMDKAEIKNRMRKV